MPLPRARVPVLRRALLARFDRVPRDMPWRGETDPYRIWVSEVMLQQTRVDTIRTRFPPFVARFPTVEALAAASDDAVMKAWEGLGYYSRARNLLRAARTVVTRHGGRLPPDVAALRELPGFGPYTAAAVASLAFGLPAAVVDGNVERVLSRLTNDHGDIRSAATRARIRAAADLLVDPRRPGDWNGALMDLGSVLCTPRTPRCEECPFARACAARAAGTAERLPVKPAPRARPHHDIAVGLVWKGGSVLVGRRPAEGLLGGLHEWPGGKREAGESLEAACVREIREETGLTVEILEPFAAVDHAYSHFEITLHVFHCRPRSGRLRARGIEALRWVPWERLGDLAFPRANLHVLDALRRVGPPAGAGIRGIRRTSR